MPHRFINGHEMHFHRLGDDGPAIIMVHPPFMGMKVFNYLREDLARDHKVITFDVRGHGHSEPGKAKLTMPLIAEDMKQLLDRLDIKEAYVCSYSAASLPAFEAMITHPDRFIGGIILSGSSELKDRRSRSLMRAANFAHRLRAKEAAIVPIALGHADSRTTFGVLHQEMMSGHAVRTREYAHACLKYSCTDQLRRIGGPVLLMCGQNDKAYVRYNEMLHDRLPVSEFYILRDAEHHLPTKEQDKVASTIRTWIAKDQGLRTADTFSERQSLDRELLEMGVLNDRQAGVNLDNPQQIQ